MTKQDAYRQLHALSRCAALAAAKGDRAMYMRHRKSIAKILDELGHEPPARLKIYHPPKGK